MHAEHVSRRAELRVTTKKGHRCSTSSVSLSHTGLFIKQDEADEERERNEEEGHSEGGGEEERAEDVE